MKIYDFKNDVLWGVSCVTEYMVEIIPPPPLTIKERVIIFWREHLYPALLQTVVIGCYAYFIASIFKWVMM